MSGQAIAVALSFVATLLSTSPRAEAGEVERDGSVSSGSGSTIGTGHDGLSSVTYLIGPCGDYPRGSNLFHSFRVFDVAAGEIASFVGPPGVRIDNVIARVTGGSTSRIDGTLRVRIPNASLYLLNPAGIFFGSGAKLDLSGAFHAATGSALRFDDGTEFRADLTGASPELTSARPLGFDPPRLSDGAILLDGPNLLLRGAVDIELAASRIELRNGARIDTGMSVGTDGLAGGSIDLLAADTIRLSGRTSAYYASALSSSAPGRGAGANAGDITLRARAIELSDGARIDANVGAEAGLPGDIHLEAEESIDLSGTACFGDSCFQIGDTTFILAALGASISSTTLGDRGGALIRLAAPIIHLADGAEVIAIPGGGGRGGDIEIAASRSLLMEGSDDTLLGSTVMTSPFATGAGGSIRIDAGTIALRDGATIASGPDFRSDEALYGERSDATPAAGGVIRIRATSRIELDGFGSWEPSSIAGTTNATGDGGSLFVEAPRIDISNGAAIASNAAARGNGGDVHIVASARLTVSGTGGVATIRPSEISASAQSADPDGGDAGSVFVMAPRMEILDGGQIATEAKHGRSDGSGVPEGTISIAASDSLQLDGESRISASVVEGRGGDVRIAAPETIVLRNGSSILAEATAAGSGIGGRIDIEAGSLFQSLDSRISADAGVGGTDGTVRIESPEVDLESALVPLGAEFLDASALQRGSCAARAAAEGESRFAVTTRRAVATTAEGIELASFSPGGDLGSEPGQVSEREPAAEHAARDATRASGLWAAAEAELARGRLREAIPPLTESLSAAERSGDEEGVRGAASRLSDTYRSLDEGERANDVVEGAAERAETAGRPALAATLLDDDAEQFASRRDLRRAAARNRTAIESAQRAKRKDHELLLRSKAARMEFQAGERDRARAGLEDADRLAVSLAPTKLASAALIHLAGTHRQLASGSEARDAAHLRAFVALSRALSIATDYADDRGRSFALGHLGDLYLEAGHADEAQVLAVAALRAAERADAADAAYRWHFLLARILEGLGRPDDAIEENRRAVVLLEELRGSMRTRDEGAEVRFRSEVAPVYRELVDRLLRRHAQSQAAALLEEARFRMEQVKAAELRNYFRDDCAVELAARARPLESVGKNVAVVYPVLLEDRVELIVSLPSGLRRFRAPAEATRSSVEDHASALRKALEHGAEGRADALALHDWLVAPFESELTADHVTTLVFVPDELLRAIPFAVLRSDSSFLIERYAVAATASLELLDPNPLEQRSVHALVAGASRPVGAAPLPFAAAELREVHDRFGGELLLEEAFAPDRIERELRDGQPTLVHIASHADFTGDPTTTHVLTGTGEQISLEELRSWVGYARFRSRPIELLVLSACETASGNDRAALGLAGAALAAGARSALGSLWKIYDAEARDVITRFYAELANPGVTKAEALQRAQIAAIRAGVASAKWSPFVLLNNWL